MTTNNTRTMAKNSYQFVFSDASAPSPKTARPKTASPSSAMMWPSSGELSQVIQRALKAPEAGFWPEAHNSEMWTKVAQRAQQIRQQFSGFVICGIGGSSLGAKTLTALNPKAEVFFLEHLDPDSLADFRARLGDRDLDLKDLHWVWTSKSGTTLETISNLCLIDGWYQDLQLDLSKRSTAVCEPKASPLKNWADRHQVPTFDIPTQVSGRFSVLSPAGLLAAALAGVDLSLLREGVRSVSPDSPEIVRLIENTLASWKREEFVTSVWTYCDRLKPFVLWLQQLWAESLAKKKTRQGRPAPRVSFMAPSVGSIDQHSLLQQFVEGGPTNWIWTLRVTDLEDSGEVIHHCPFPEMQWLKGKKAGQIFAAQAEGTLKSLRNAGAHTFEWRWPKFDAFYLGQAFITMEILVAALAEALDIHGFDQPGVEGGKLATLSLLKEGSC